MTESSTAQRLSLQNDHCEPGNGNISDLNTTSDKPDDSDDDSIMEFPCQFPIKVIGRDENDFRSLAVGLVQTHTGEIESLSITENVSRNGRFLSLTITVTAVSREQLDQIYESLSASPSILVAL